MTSKESQSRHRPEAKHREHRVGTIIIALFLTILVCSFLFVSNLAHHNSAATARASSTGSPATSTQLKVYVGTANGTLVKLNAANGKVIWRYATNGSHLPAPATIANGTVYVGTQDGSIYALNAATDAVLWHFQTQAAVLSSPTVANGFVYVGSSDGFLYKLQASDGTLLWRKNMSLATAVVSVNTATVSNNVVYVSSTDNTSHSYLFALNASNGSSLWNAQVTNQLFTAPVVVNGTIYIDSSALQQQGGPDITDSYVYAFNAANGTQLWRSNKIGNYIPAQPAVANNVVYVGSQDNYLYAFDATSGKQLWRYNAGGAINASPEVADGVVYIGITATATVNPAGSTTDTTASQSAIAAIQASNGTQLWKHPLDQYAGTPLTVSQHVIYVGVGSDFVYALSATDGAQIWRYTDSTTGMVSNNAPITVAP
ncbi:MAG TPA: PQQ-binding-like beta-propeller repeat protein [Ktedonobacteraceae bacterium]|nr:PQQ-binding-like beta-propeller repeat protein [Ktedonobacteraceae bacterium]